MTRRFQLGMRKGKREAPPPFFMGDAPAYLAVGMTNSAPLAIESGQRCITLL
ncbi:hypothetical protein DP23_1600 [Ralstonia pickettii]|nr:hypothetical protein DP23_1600 [Ralstonia pickettii]